MFDFIERFILGLLILGIFIEPHSIHAQIVDYTLVIDHQIIQIKGKSAHGMTLNGKIPGPVLRFREGDRARGAQQNECGHFHSLA